MACWSCSVIVSFSGMVDSQNEASRSGGVFPQNGRSNWGLTSMANEGMFLRQHVAHYESLPGAPTPLWTRLLIETSNGELWVAACNFAPELPDLAKRSGGRIPVLTHEGHDYVQLEAVIRTSDAAASVGEAIKGLLPDAKCVWRAK